jgi:hypothetical protein
MILENCLKLFTCGQRGLLFGDEEKSFPFSFACRFQRILISGLGFVEFPTSLFHTPSEDIVLLIRALFQSQLRTALE